MNEHFTQFEFFIKIKLGIECHSNNIEHSNKIEGHLNYMGH